MRDLHEAIVKKRRTLIEHEGHAQKKQVKDFLSKLHSISPLDVFAKLFGYMFVLPFQALELFVDLLYFLFP